MKNKWKRKSNWALRSQRTGEEKASTLHWNSASGAIFKCTGIHLSGKFLTGKKNVTSKFDSCVNCVNYHFSSEAFFLIQLFDQHSKNKNKTTTAAEQTERCFLLLSTTADYLPSVLNF